MDFGKNFQELSLIAIIIFYSDPISSTSILLSGGTCLLNVPGSYSYRPSTAFYIRSIESLNISSNLRAYAIGKAVRIMVDHMIILVSVDDSARLPDTWL